jgi:hypothetical protein
LRLVQLPVALERRLRNAMNRVGLLLVLCVSTTSLGCKQRSAGPLDVSQEDLEAQIIRIQQSSDDPDKTAKLLCLQNALFEIEQTRKSGRATLDRPLATGCVLIPLSIGGGNEVNYFRVQAHFLQGRSEAKSIKIGWDDCSIVVDVSELDQRPFGGPDGVGIEGVVVFNLIEEGLEAKQTSPWNVIVNAKLWRELHARANDYAVAMSVSDGREWTRPCPASIEP